MMVPGLNRLAIQVHDLSAMPETHIKVEGEEKTYTMLSSNIHVRTLGCMLANILCAYLHVQKDTNDNNG